MAAAAEAAAALSDLVTLGDAVGTVPLPPTAYGIKASTQTGPVEVSVRRFQVRTAPPEVKVGARRAALRGNQATLESSSVGARSDGCVLCLLCLS